MRTLIFLAFRNLWRHPWRSLATVLGVALGIAAVFATLSVGDNVRANLNSSLEAAAGKADLLVTPGASGRAVFEIADIFVAVQDTPGVAEVFPVLNVRAEPVRDIKGFEDDSLLPGVDSGFQLSGRVQDPDAIPGVLTAGEFPEVGSSEVVMAEAFARSREIDIGDTVPFASRFGDLPFTVTGFLDDAQGLASTNGGRVGIMALADLQEAMHLSGRASYLEVIVAEGADLQAVSKALQNAIGEAYTVTVPAGSGRVATGVVNTLQAGLQVLAATLLALGGFMAYNTFAAAVLERTREYALLRTICMTRKEVQRLAMTEAFFISLVGVACGILLGLALSFGITRINALALGFEFRTLVVPFTSILAAAGVGIAVSLFAGLLPASTASKTPPLAATRRSEETQPSGSLWLGWLFIALGIVAALSPWQDYWALLGAALSMGLLFIGLSFITPLLLRPALMLLKPLLIRLYGVAGRLGAEFTQRNAQRNGVAIGAVVVGMGLTIGVGAMIAGINKEIAAWVDTTIVGDLFVTTPINFPADFASQVSEEVPAIAEISGVGVRVVRFQPVGEARARSVALILVDPERFNPELGFGSFQYVQGQGNNLTGYRALLEGGQMLAANTIRDRFGVEKGDTVKLRTDEGFAEFGVAGVIVDFTGGGEAFVANIEELERFGGGSPDLYVMTVEEDTSPQAAREALLAAFPELYLDATLNQEYRQNIMQLTQQSFATTNALLFLAVFIAALGVANTLGMNLSRRQHDIAVLRAIGLSRTDVRRLITAEGIVIVTVGTVLGLLTGLLLSQVITAGANALTGYLIEPVYPWRLMVIALLSSPLIGLLASFLPARRAAQLSPIRALGSAE